MLGGGATPVLCVPALHACNAGVHLPCSEEEGTPPLAAHQIAQRKLGSAEERPPETIWHATCVAVEEFSGYGDTFSPWPPAVGDAEESPRPAAEGGRVLVVQQAADEEAKTLDESGLSWPARGPSRDAVKSGIGGHDEEPW